eukprot:snap_masked-scaffold_75-processed-gene-0.55-mRNA-1 protein AED:1.00 eAED:1.00 QI:0/-1/0/0/-1/1/1/0/69
MNLSETFSSWTQEHLATSQEKRTCSSGWTNVNLNGLQRPTATFPASLKEQSISFLRMVGKLSLEKSFLP